ncbi:Gfo/Idh/MocA family protein [Proteiniphilum sp. UBA5384]|uniref:Gfo/Idh/MocA family protein n=1 Tax=Proteiniphilum sp. UBA5384 TaxID=1947279 RepID=UPI0025DFD649|nr:Gfo/Idh/MocA family oxidoreductase [Proteiniphilum sp. UBA5384]
MSSKISRRKFIGAAVTAVAGLTVVPSPVLGKRTGHIAPTDRLNIAGVGIGGRGFAVLKEMQSQNIVALADVDWKYSKPAFDYFPKAKRYYDYRKMYDEVGKSIDAVMVATSDHTHAIIAADAITIGKHVYVEKPLTHSVYESRLLNKLAKKHKVATQMGNGGASSPGIRQIIDWIWDGQIGEVGKVEAFTDRPIWPQGLSRPSGTERKPNTLDWNLFIGPTSMRPYQSIYTPWNWRGWWDFGTGALGDMACHILFPVFKALNLRYPAKVQGSSSMLMSESCPTAQMFKYVFPARDNMPKAGMPEVEITWYDGGLQPPRPDGIPAGNELNIQGGGVIFYGSKDTLICGSSGAEPYLLSGRNPHSPETQREVALSHQMDWVRACKESYENRIEPASDFEIAGPFNEMIVMGVLAVRLQGLNQELAWDGEKMEFTNIPADATISAVVEDGFKIKDGHPAFDKTWTEPQNAREFARELINHTYHNGWKLPPMP